MNYDAHEVESLRQQYRTELNRAEQAADSGRPQEAAEHYRNAADTKVAIARERGTPVPDRAHELRSIADRAEKGNTIHRIDKGNPQHGDREPSAAHNPSDGPTDGGDNPSEFREVIESFIVETDTTWAEIGGLEETKPVSDARSRWVQLATNRTPFKQPRVVSFLAPRGRGRRCLRKLSQRRRTPRFLM